jgi:SAM-dependent methyltransferase
VPAVDWALYLTGFHAERPGITEAVLARATETGVDPYGWVAEALPQDGRVVDVACGSGPLATRLGARWIGLDRSTEELARARRRAPGRVASGDAGALPVAGGAAAAVVCAMALMLVDPAGALAETRRVLAPGGRFVALLPAPGPLSPRDRLRYGRLLLALRRRRLPFPSDEALDRAGPRLLSAGLRLVADERRRFTLPIDDAAGAELFVRSLYLPAVPPARVARATAVARRWTGSTLGLPLRRVVAVAEP